MFIFNWTQIKGEFAYHKIGAGDAEKGKILTVKNCFAEVDYISSPYLRSMMNSLDSKPLQFKYDDADIIYKAVPVKSGHKYQKKINCVKMNQQSVRMENLRGGNTPQFVFFGLIETEALNGSSTLSSSVFKNYDLQEVSLTLNGQTCQEWFKIEIYFLIKFPKLTIVNLC